MNNRKPILLAPASKDYIWGGNRLNDDFNLGLSCEPAAEAWMCSTHPSGPSYVPSAGCYLPELLRKNPDWLGTHPLRMTGGVAELPILIKLIDAKQDLSVQVHPDDTFAMANEGQWGKSELWYVLAAKKESQIVFGFREQMEPEQVRKAVEAGNIEQYLNRVPVHKNDVFFIESGTVHAIGAGCLIAEIQESSDVTYRLYDYGRTDRNGKRRELHLEKALKVARLHSTDEPRQPMRILNYRNGSARELLMRCRYFQTERVLLNTEGRKLADFQTGTNSFHALLCVEGCGVLFGEDFMMNFYKGDCAFVPADSIPLKLHGKAQLLDISC